MCSTWLRKTVRIITGAMAWCQVMKSCQQIRFVEILYSLRWFVGFVLQSQTRSSCSKSSMEYSEKEPALQCQRQSARRTHRHWSLVQGLLRESWIKGSSDSWTIYVGRTVGLWRYKTEDFLPCPDGTLLCVEGKLGIDLLLYNRICVTLAPSGVYINRMV